MNVRHDGIKYALSGSTRRGDGHGKKGPRGKLKRDPESLKGSPRSLGGDLPGATKKVGGKKEERPIFNREEEKGAKKGGLLKVGQRNHSHSQDQFPRFPGKKIGWITFQKKKNGTGKDRTLLRDVRKRAEIKEVRRTGIRVD